MAKQTIAVTDGDAGADILGYAADEADALALARDAMVDEVVRVERYGPIRLADGTCLGEAFVAFTGAAA